MKLALVAALLLPVAVPSLAALRDERTSDGHPSDIRSLIERHETDRVDLERFLTVPAAATRIDRLERHAREALAALDGIDESTLSVEDRIDLALLHNANERELHRLSATRRRLDAVAPLIPFAEAVRALEEARWRIAPVDARAAAGIVHGIAESAREMESALRTALDAGSIGPDWRLAPPLALRAADAVGQVRGVLDRWFRHHDGFRPDFGWWVREPFGAASDALDSYGRFLREEIAGQRGQADDPLVGEPIGRDMLVVELQHEFVPYAPEELIDIAERERAWCQARLLVAAESLGVAAWREAIEHVKSLHVEPGEQDRLVVGQAHEAIDFVVGRDLVTVPDLALETWRIEMLSAERQRVLPFAAYGGQHMLVAYPTDAMEHRRKIESMRGNNRHFTRIVTAHELIPGHHLQGFAAARHNTHRRAFRTPFLVEGWALHWEMRLWDLGFAGGPEDEVGMLFWRLHRCARIVVSLRFHLGEMTPDEMVAYLVDEVGLERDGATAEVRRYIGDAYGPLYQVAYMIGGLQMRALHREMVIDGTMSERDFHDAVLRANSIPIELIRSSLRGEAPTRGVGATWRFDDAGRGS